MGKRKRIEASCSGRGRPERIAAMMGAFLTISRAIDALNERFGRIADWCVLLAVLISAGNAFVALSVQLQLERLAGDPVVHVRRPCSCSARPIR